MMFISTKIPGTILFSLVFLAGGMITASASPAGQVQPAQDVTYTETVIVPSIKVGAQGVGGVTFFNGTIVNATTGDDDANNPVTFGDDVRIDGRVYRGATAGPETDSSTPFIINDNLQVLGTIQGSSLIGAGQLTTSNSGSTGQVLSLNSSGVLEWTDDAAGSSTTGDITGVTAGNGLTGGGTSGGVTLNVSGVTSAMITDGTIVAGDLASNAVTSAEILDGTVASGDIANDTIDFSKIVDSPDLDADLSIENKALFIGNTGGSYAGRIGIGTATPNSTIQVANYINFDNTGDLRLTALGYQAGNSLANDGYRNTLVGYQAGDGITSGTDNTAVGDTTLGAAATSSYSTAIGGGALEANTDSNNTAVGYNALTVNTSGTEVTAIGSTALDANTDGERNLAVGYNALGANTSADDNVAVGHSALAVSNATSNRNTAVGNYSLDAATTGVWNTAVGYGTLGNGSGVDSSVAVGYLALQLATGDNNIAIGYQAGNNITSGNNNIVIGHDIDAPMAGGSDLLNIGGVLYGDLTGSDQNIGINTVGFDGTAAGVLAIANGVAPAAGTADQSYIYAKDVTASSEMHVMDEAGNETQISPHDPETGNWIYYSKNVETGRVLRIEMEDLIFDIAAEMSQKTGKEYVHEYFE